MERQEKISLIRASWKELYQLDGTKKGITCPLCGNGSGTNGDGIREVPRSNGSLKCFKCGFSGDVIDLYMAEKGSISFNQAIEDLGAKIGLTESFSDSTIASKVMQKKAILDSSKEQRDEPATDWSRYAIECACRINEPDAVEYLSKRGISVDTASSLGIGYDGAWVNSRAAAQYPNIPGTPRIIIPSYHFNGDDVKVTHYVARDIRPDADKKYSKMNEGSTDIFNEQALFRDDASTVFVVEGAMDALSIVEAGCDAIALNSTSNVNKLLNLLQEKTTRATVAVCLDNDEAGRKAATVLMDGLKRLNISYASVDVCGGYKDPNEALCGNRKQFIDDVRKAAQKTSSRPDSVSSYINSMMDGEIDRFKTASKRYTGFGNLDERIGGLYAGLYVIGAISSLGKTTFALQMADQLAMNGEEVIFFSMEQSKLEMVSKSIARTYAIKYRTVNDVTSLQIRGGLRTQEVQEAIKEYAGKVGDRVSIIEGNFNCNISFIGDYIREYIRKTGVRPVVFIDYLQILQGDEAARTKSTKDMVDMTMTELKRISRSLDITIFVISSINRSNYLAPIDFESFKESGGIEYTADVVWGLQLQCMSDEVFSKKENIKEKREKVREAKSRTPRQIELVCLKNRYGISSFSCYFKYFPQCDLFRQAESVNDLYDGGRQKPTRPAI